MEPLLFSKQKQDGKTVLVIWRDDGDLQSPGLVILPEEAHEILYEANKLQLK